jgi:hypothetical protein
MTDVIKIIAIFSAVTPYISAFYDVVSIQSAERRMLRWLMI